MCWKWNAFLSYETLNNIKVKLPDIKTQEKYEKLLDLTETKVKLEGTKLQSLNKIKNLYYNKCSFKKDYTLKCNPFLSL